MKLLAVAYVVALHVALALLVWKTDFRDRMREYRIRHGFVFPRGIVFVGDSITRNMPWPNYGLQGLPTRKLLPLLPNYRNADCIVLTIGLNDLLRGEKPLFAEIAATDTPLVWIGLYPNRVVDVAAANDAIRAACKAPNCTFVDPGPLPLLPDGLHVADYSSLRGVSGRCHRGAPVSTP